MTGTVKALTYDWNGNKDMPIMGAQFSDFEIAAKVRMLMRDQLDHEAVCVMARDRIMALSKQVAALTASASEPASVEAVARAICLAEDVDPEGEIYDTDLGVIISPAWGFYKKQATAALAVRLVSPVPASEPEPVAWQHRGRILQPTSVWTDWCSGKASEITRKQAAAGYIEIEERPLYANPAPTPDGAVEALAKAEWQSLVDKDDRTSPDEYPDMALITFDELRDIIRSAALETPWQKPGRAAQAQAGEKPDFPADEQSGETSHGAVTDAMVAAAWNAGKHRRMTGLPPDFRAVLEAARLAALSHPADGWRDIDTLTPKTGDEFIARCGKDKPAFSCFWDGAAFVHYDHDEGLIAYPITEWMPFPAAKPKGE